MKLIKLSILFLAGYLGLSPALAKGLTKEALAENPELASLLFRPYPDHEIDKLSDAPEGYRPFYISHYGRHGSRWLSNKQEYNYVAGPLEKAAAAGALTPKGKQVYEKVKLACEQASGIEGSLSPLGTTQHQGIAKRMYSNFPDIFANNADIDARSTLTVRCVLSMNAFCMSLKEMNPAMSMNFEASDRTTSKLAHVYGIANEIDPAYRELWKSGDFLKDTYAIAKEKMHSDDFLKSIFTKNIFSSQKEEMDFLFYLFYLVCDQQNVMPENRMWDIYTPEQLYWMTVAENFRAFAKFGPYPGTDKWTLTYATPLLEDMVNRCDSAVNGNGRSADLRFGHDVVLMALLPLMSVNGCDNVSTDPLKIMEEWNLYALTPMAANLQMVFYRPVNKNKGDILVKLLLNEKEATLPIEAEEGKYYSWNKVRQHLINRIEKYRKNDTGKSN